MSICAFVLPGLSRSADGNVRLVCVMQVVVEEEDDAGRYGVRQISKKERYVAQLVSPARPNYMYGCIDERVVRHATVRLRQVEWSWASCMLFTFGGVLLTAGCISGKA